MNSHNPEGRAESFVNITRLLQNTGKVSNDVIRGFILRKTTGTLPRRELKIASTCLSSAFFFLISYAYLPVGTSNFIYLRCQGRDKLF